jgi:hypothetical protein
LVTEDQIEDAPEQPQEPSPNPAPLEESPFVLPELDPVEADLKPSEKETRG